MNLPPLSKGPLWTLLRSTGRTWCANIMAVILQMLSRTQHTIELPLTNTSWNQIFLLLLFQCNHNFSQLKQFNYNCSVANDNHKSLVGLIYMKKLMSTAHIKSCIINWLWQSRENWWQNPWLILSNTGLTLTFRMSNYTSHQQQTTDDLGQNGIFPLIYQYPLDLM